MRLLIIECGTSQLAGSIADQANKLRPKPAMISTMNVVLPQFNAPEFKRTLFYLAPDVIILDPPTEVPDAGKWESLVKETIRHTDIVSGRLVFVSSVEVLGDAQLRTEAATEMPYSDIGVFLQAAETVIREQLSSHYILRFPYTEEHEKVKGWLQHSSSSVHDNEMFTLALINEMAATIMDKVQSGWFGTYHVTPNDMVLLSNLLGTTCNETIRVPNRSLFSKHAWKLMHSEAVWDGVLFKGEKKDEVGPKY